MPRAVDHDLRRRQLAEAVWNLLERDGVAGASVRGVAAEAGLSTGSVRHFFGTQAELHLFAMTALTERVGARVGALEAEADPRRRALGMLEELMPLREQTRSELLVWWEFVHRSRHDPALAAVVLDQARSVRALLRRVVDGLTEHGLLRGDDDPDQRVRTLNAVVDGLTFELLASPGLIDAAGARAVLELHLLGARRPPGR